MVSSAWNVSLSPFSHPARLSTQIGCLCEAFACLLEALEFPAVLPEHRATISLLERVMLLWD